MRLYKIPSPTPTLSLITSFIHCIFSVPLILVSLLTVALLSIFLHHDLSLLSHGLDRFPLRYSQGPFPPSLRPLLRCHLIREAFFVHTAHTHVNLYSLPLFYFSLEHLSHLIYTSLLIELLPLSLPLMSVPKGQSLCFLCYHNPSTQNCARHTGDKFAEYRENVYICPFSKCGCL